MDRQVFAVKRAAIVTLAVIAIVLGVIAFFWAGATLATIGFLFGIYLVVAGVQRIVRAITDRKGVRSLFLINLIAGIIVTVAGVLALTNTTKSLVFLAIIVGAGWILGGIVDLVVAFRTLRGTARVIAVIGALLSILAGAALVFLPGVAAPVFLKIGAVLLVVVGIGVLLTFPRALKNAE